ncbi:MAG: radical SAM protein [Phycisphaeraceae bacterium]|nr:radical SAM protein [Phycisphaeraceae bacterium]
MASRKSELLLFGHPLPDRIGQASVEGVDVSSILTKASGFMGAYDYTLNPYSGCSFGCTYCYAAFFAREPELRDSWGKWVQVKQNAVDRIRRMRSEIRGKTIYMSSVTDPYQPIEKQARIVRDILEELVIHQPRLVIQTRSDLVKRDIDILKHFEVVRVNMTVTTDSEEVRKVFEPYCPSLQRRLAGIQAIHEAGIRSCITMTPLLPIQDLTAFADALIATGLRDFVVQPFHTVRGRFVAGTREGARALVERMGWDDTKYRYVVDYLRTRLPSLYEGQEGFAPA